ncbi:MAG: hypothetical protein ACOCP4_02090, partial [Candidatus Woesearchaeota archaeon]
MFKVQCFYQTKYLLVATEIEKLKKVNENFEVNEIINNILNLTDKPVLIYGSFIKGNWKKSSDL